MEQKSLEIIQSALILAADLKLAAPLSAGAFDGHRTGSRSGGAMEFAEYRSYREGDPLRRIDWRLYARSEQLMVRRFAQETDPRCDIIIDCSASMALYDKSAAAAGMAAFFAKCALNAGFSLQVWALKDEVIKIDDPGEPLLWKVPESDGRGDPPEILQSSPPGFYRNGLRIFLSDLFFETPPGSFMGALGGNPIVIQLLGAEEQEPSVTGDVTLEDPESGTFKTLQIDVNVIAEYKEQLSLFQNKWADDVRNCGGKIFFFTATEVLKEWKMEQFFREGVLQ